MRAGDLPDYFALRRIVREPWRALRFRKRRSRGEDLELQLRAGRRLRLRGASQDYHIFSRIFVRDEYRLGGFRRLGRVLDVGANIGLFAIRVLPLAEEVICYEPLPENFAQLEANLGASDNVTLVPHAIAGRSGDLRCIVLRTSA